MKNLEKLADQVSAALAESSPSISHWMGLFFFNREEERGFDFPLCKTGLQNNAQLLFLGEKKKE